MICLGSNFEDGTIYLKLYFLSKSIDRPIKNRLWYNQPIERWMTKANQFYDALCFVGPQHLAANKTHKYKRKG